MYSHFEILGHLNFQKHTVEGFVTILQASTARHRSVFWCIPARIAQMFPTVSNLPEAQTGHAVALSDLPSSNPASLDVHPSDTPPSEFPSSRTSKDGGFELEVQPVSDSTKASYPDFSSIRTFVIIATVACITTASSMSTGLLLVGLPRMALDLQLPDNLLLW